MVLYKYCIIIIIIIIIITIIIVTCECERRTRSVITLASWAALTGAAYDLGLNIKINKLHK